MMKVSSFKEKRSFENFKSLYKVAFTFETFKKLFSESSKMKMREKKGSQTVSDVFHNFHNFKNQQS